MKLIVFEGIDGAGKGQQILYFRNYIENVTGKSVVVTQEPSKLPVGEYIRNLIKTEVKDTVLMAVLYLADREMHISHMLNKYKDRIILCDRFILSTFAYQVYGSSIKDTRQAIRSLATRTSDVFIKQIGKENVKNIYIDVLPTVAYSRLLKSNKELDAIENRAFSFFDNVRNGYLKLIQDDKYGECFLVDGNLSPFGVSHQIEGIIHKII